MEEMEKSVRPVDTLPPVAAAGPAVCVCASEPECETAQGASEVKTTLGNILPEQDNF